ncbi:hypothetical protein [Mycobacterium colombiense]|uniref:Uncharacterized protein n=1 Tax=Mycobacterium colombiense TaxID=339268 RepID=A0A1A2Z024_9MYCO|nr:hypothetical protein [Mycobacterium colombiense]OBI42988.1 hypothetical protein A5708_19305 [Mycobacterium colombiense]
MGFWNFTADYYETTPYTPHEMCTNLEWSYDATDLMIEAQEAIVRLFIRELGRAPRTEELIAGATVSARYSTDWGQRLAKKARVVTHSTNNIHDGSFIEWTEFEFTPDDEEAVEREIREERERERQEHELRRKAEQRLRELEERRNWKLKG